MGIDVDKINKIVFQCWISGFMVDGFEVWFDWCCFDILKLEVGLVCIMIDYIFYCY